MIGMNIWRRTRHVGASTKFVAPKVSKESMPIVIHTFSAFWWTSNAEMMMRAITATLTSSGRTSNNARSLKRLPRVDIQINGGMEVLCEDI